MPQLTKQDVADVVEEVLDRVLDRKLDEKLDKKLNEKLGLRSGQTLDDKLGLKPGETLNGKLDKRFSDFEKRMDKKMDDKFGFFVEHMDDRFDGLTEAVSLMNESLQKKAGQSDLDEVKDDVKTIRLAITDTNEDIRHLGKNF